MRNLLTIIAPRTPTDQAFGRRAWRWLRERVRGVDLEVTGLHVLLYVPWEGEQDLQRALELLTRWNMAALRARPLPPLYESGVRYEREPKCRIRGLERVCEEWLTAHEVYARGKGDCEDLSGWLAAERQLAGEHDQAVPTRSRVGFHIVVQRADGAREDPSRELGMLVRRVV